MTDHSTHALPFRSHAPLRLRAVVTSGRDSGAAICVDRPVLVGSSELCDLRLTDRTVSRRHLELEPSEIGVRARDPQSRNGCWVGPLRVRDVELAEGAEIRVGNTVLRIEQEPARAGAEAPASEPGRKRTSFGRFIGASPRLTTLYVQLERVAPTDTTVLLEGESGTGKELLAEALHDHSARHRGPLVVVDLGAVPAQLIESQLFGHEAGAFTGAVRRHMGAFERANGGTIFLDEIGELPLEFQSRLLRVLDRREIRRVGGTADIPIDVRVIVATNRNLEREVEEERFRSDLFHRVAVVLLRIPPLCERSDDIEVLARHFLEASRHDASILTPEVVTRLRAHDWPGNTRELRNFVERLALLGSDVAPLAARVRTDNAESLARSGLPFREARARALDAFTAAYVDDMLARHGGNVSKAAAAAGIARRYFQKLKEDDAE